MPTIKELAAEAGLSASTVSIVLRGKSKERNIPEVTQKRVWDAAKKLGYHPNVAARRLRVQAAESFVIAVFWASDFRAQLMVRFLRGLLEATLGNEKKCEIVIHPYKNNELHQSILALGMCNAAIICNASEADLKFLENYSFPVPIVLYNRHSAKFCTVNVDDIKLGALAAETFAARGHKSAVLLTSKSVFRGMDDRMLGFKHTCGEKGLIVRLVESESSMKGGYLGGEQICALEPKPDCVFCTSDNLAIGAMKALGRGGIRIPEQMELISIGNGDRELEEYASTSLSVVQLPMEKMASACLHLAFDLLSGETEPPYSIELPIRYIARESCGDRPDAEK